MYWAHAILVSGALAFLVTSAPLAPGHSSVPELSTSLPSLNASSDVQISTLVTTPFHKKDIRYSQVVFTIASPAMSTIENADQVSQFSEEVVMDYTHDVTANNSWSNLSDRDESASPAEARAAKSVPPFIPKLVKRLDPIVEPELNKARSTTAPVTETSTQKSIAKLEQVSLHLKGMTVSKNAFDTAYSTVKSNVGQTEVSVTTNSAGDLYDVFEGDFDHSTVKRHGGMVNSVVGIATTPIPSSDGNTDDSLQKYANENAVVSSPEREAELTASDISSLIEVPGVNQLPKNQTENEHHLSEQNIHSFFRVGVGRNNSTVNHDATIAFDARAVQEIIKIKAGQNKDELMVLQLLNANSVDNVTDAFISEQGENNTKVENNGQQIMNATYIDTNNQKITEVAALSISGRKEYNQKRSDHYEGSQGNVNIESPDYALFEGGAPVGGRRLIERTVETTSSAYEPTIIRIPISKITTPIISFVIDVTTEYTPTQHTIMRQNSSDSGRVTTQSQNGTKTTEDPNFISGNKHERVVNNGSVDANVLHSLENKKGNKQTPSTGVSKVSRYATAYPTSSMTEFVTIDNGAVSPSANVAAIDHKMLTLELISRNSKGSSNSTEVVETTVPTHADSDEPTAITPVDLLTNESTRISSFEESRTPQSTIYSALTALNVLSTKQPIVLDEGALTDGSVVQPSDSGTTELSKNLDKGSAEFPSLSRSINSTTSRSRQNHGDIELADLEILSHFSTVDPNMVYRIIRKTASTSATPIEEQKEDDRANTGSRLQHSKNSWLPTVSNFALGLEGLFELENDQAKMRIMSLKADETNHDKSKFVDMGSRDRRAPQGEKHPLPRGIPSFFSDGPPSNIMEFPWDTLNNNFDSSELHLRQEPTTDSLPVASTTAKTASTSTFTIGSTDRADGTASAAHLSTTSAPSSRIILISPKKPPGPPVPLATIAVTPKKFNLFASLTQYPNYDNTGSKSIQRRPVLPSKKTAPVRSEPYIEAPTNKEDNEGQMKDITLNFSKNSFIGNYERRLVIDTLPTSTTSRPRSPPQLNLHDFQRGNRHQGQKPSITAATHDFRTGLDAVGFRFEWPRRESDEDHYDLRHDDDPYDLLLKGTFPAPSSGHHPISERARATLLMCVGIVAGATVFFASMLLVCRRRSQNARLLRRRAVDKFIAEQHDAASEAASSYGGSHSSYGRKGLLPQR